MCANHPFKRNKSFIFLISSIGLALLGHFLSIPGTVYAAELIQLVFQKIMKLISIPIIFLSIFSIILKMHGKLELKKLFQQSVFYTLATTTVAACVAVFLIFLLKSFLFINLSSPHISNSSNLNWNWLEEIIPEHAFQPFMTGNVMSSLILAVFMGISFTRISEAKKVEQFSSIILDGLMKMASAIIKMMPLIIYSSLTLTLQIKGSFSQLKEISFFLIIVILANIIQGTVILPLLLRSYKIPVWETFFGFKKALIYAFFSKSSIATLPIATRCAEDNLNISPNVTKFTFPIFTTINMNGCAAFIITALSLSVLHDFSTISPIQALIMLVLSVVAAVGNAGVPMGCYFLSTALISAMNLDMKLIGLILPFYGFIDMIETSLNVWSDAVITTIINKKMTEKVEIESAL